MKKDIAIKLSYMGFSRASDYSWSQHNHRWSQISILDDDGYLDIDFDGEQLIGQKYNPDIDYWFKD